MKYLSDNPVALVWISLPTIYFGFFGLTSIVFEDDKFIGASLLLVAIMYLPFNIKLYKEAKKIEVLND